jgi:uncharacterized protein YecA (UPF0149 family)
MKKSLATIGVVGHGLALGSLAAKTIENKKEKVVIVYDEYHNDNNGSGLEAAEKAKAQLESEGKEVQLMTQEAYAVLERQRETFGNPNKKYIANPRHEELMELPVEADWKRNLNAKNPSKRATYHPIRTEPKIQRNDACSCGSGIKYKKCCGK